MKFPLIWNSEKVPPDSDYKKYVEPELIKVFENLEAAENLIFHTIFIGDNPEGPIVMAYGKDGSPNIYLDYIPEYEWTFA
jgi:hypothetical protein